jgi:hypothetical protein
MENTNSNSANSANQPADTATNEDISARTRANRRIDATTISEIARLCARQLTESEACRKIGIRPRHWFNWKDKHNRSEKFAALLEAFRANRIDDLITRVEKSANGQDVKNPDWRAAAFLLSVTDAKRFSNNATQSTSTPAQAIADEVLLKIAATMRQSRLGKAAIVETASAPKQIQDAEIAPERVDRK